MKQVPAKLFLIKWEYMKAKYLYWTFLSFALLITSCTDELLDNTKALSRKLVQINQLVMNSLGANEKEIALTRTPDDHSEVDNLRLFAFDANGNKEGSWDVPPLNIREDNNADTSDGKRVYTLTNSISITTGEKTFYAIANYNRYWVNCLDELDKIDNKADFEQYLYNINSTFQENKSLPTLTNPTVLLLGSGTVTISTSSSSPDSGIAEGTIYVKRPVAHVTFKVNNTYKENDSYDENYGHTCVFTPETYTVYNIAVQSPVIALDENLLSSGNDPRTSFYDTNSFSAPAAVDDVSTFFFYIPENVQALSNNVTDYHQRDKWNGYLDGQDTKKKWTVAPPNSSFVVIAGQYVETDETGAMVRQGKVSYTIHLGDFSNTGSLGDFSVKRNWRYTYEVTIQGVDKIVTEAEAEPNEPGAEKQPGAEGDIIGYENASTIFDLDCHYEQVFVYYNLTDIANQLKGEATTVTDEMIGNAFILKASTPFAPDANYIRPYLDESAAGMDYKWIYFLPQELKTDYLGRVTPSIASYPGDNCKDNVVGTYNPKYLINPYDLCKSLGTLTRMIVDNESNADIMNMAEELHIYHLQQNDGDYIACFTAFIDEYYYQKNPLTDEFVGWDAYTRQPDRTMLIASNIEISDDGNSSYTTARTAFIQRSIQTYYNEAIADETNAMGVETYCENYQIGTTTYNGYGANSSSNGRENMKDLIRFEYDDDLQWSSYVNVDANGYWNSNTSAYMDHKIDDILTNESPYYACLSRNRDLDGDGYISNDEIRWYLPASDQYLRMNIGADAMSEASRLFLGNRAQLPSNYPHGNNNSLYEAGSIYYTSTYNSGIDYEPNIKQVLWAAEVGALGDKGAGHTDGLVRCIRNLPSKKVVTKNSDEIVVADKAMGDVSYTLKRKGYGDNALYIFDFENRLDERIYRVEDQDGAYPRHYEEPSALLMEDANRLPKGIVVAPYSVGNVNYSKATPYHDYDRDRVLAGTYNPCANFSVTGDEENNGRWRVPNLREMMVITTQADRLDFFEISDLGTSYWGNYYTTDEREITQFFYMTSTTFSGSITSPNRVGYEYQAYRNGHRSGFITTESNDGIFFVRCVRDMTDADQNEATDVPVN